MRYVTVFPECEPVHLKKDVGMLPYALGKYCGYNYSIVCRDHSFSGNEIAKFHIITIPQKSTEAVDFAKYIFMHAKEIDVLNLYHITSNRNVLWILAYKLANPKGKIHLKLDADYRMIDLIDANPRSWKGKVKRKILKDKVDLYTVESKTMRDILEKKWKLQMKVIPNGIYREDEIIPAKGADKRNLFLTVGRLGTEQKATEDILTAFEIIKTKTDWKLVLVGSIEEKFQDYINEYFRRNPDLTDRVIFTGNVSDSDALTRLYKEANVFVLPSRWESFALVLMEALECGDYLIVSDQIPSADDIGDNGKYAKCVPVGDVQALAEMMLKCTSRYSSDQEMREMYSWIHDNFTWEPIVKMLDGFIKDII